MADYTDVENVLATIVGNIVYPSGTSQPSIGAVPVRIFRGWPSGPQLDADMNAGNVLISIYSQMNVERVTTRFPDEQKVSRAPVTSITASITDNTVTFAGSVTGLQYATVIIDGPANAFSYPVQLNDTPATIAAGLAALIGGGASATAAVLTVNGRVMAARVGAAGTLSRELRRQMRAFMITVWAPREALRTAIGAPIDVALGDIDRIALPDGSSGRMLYTHAIEMDNAQLVKIYRRQMYYTVDYPTTAQGPGYAVTAPNVTPSPVQTI